MSYKVWVGYEMGIKENGLLLQSGPANVLNNGQTILTQIYIYIYIYIYIVEQLPQSYLSWHMATCPLSTTYLARV